MSRGVFLFPKKQTSWDVFGWLQSSQCDEALSESAPRSQFTPILSKHLWRIPFREHRGAPMSVPRNKQIQAQKPNFAQITSVMKQEYCNIKHQKENSKFQNKFEYWITKFENNILSPFSRYCLYLEFGVSFWYFEYFVRGLQQYIHKGIDKMSIFR